jgi:hypothetical protein
MPCKTEKFLTHAAIDSIYRKLRRLNMQCIKTLVCLALLICEQTWSKELLRSLSWAFFMPSRLTKMISAGISSGRVPFVLTVILKNRFLAKLTRSCSRYEPSSHRSGSPPLKTTKWVLIFESASRAATALF